MRDHYYERHVVLKDERAQHVLNDGPSCPCEPICVHGSDTDRIFIHNSSHIGIITVRHERAPSWWTVS